MVSKEEAMKIQVLLLAMIGFLGCAHAPEYEPNMLPAECVPPMFPSGSCHNETLNDGTGVDDHRQVCQIGSDRWILYPSGETWHIETADSGTEKVLCRLLSDGTVFWAKPNPCADRVGTYTISYQLKSGDCGELTDTITTIDHQLTTNDLINKNCVGQVLYSADNCQSNYVDIACQPGDMVENAQYTWNADASVGTGELSVRLSYCSATYRVRITRQ